MKVPAAFGFIAHRGVRLPPHVPPALGESFAGQFARGDLEEFEREFALRVRIVSGHEPIEPPPHATPRGSMLTAARESSAEASAGGVVLATSAALRAHRAESRRPLDTEPRQQQTRPFESRPSAGGRASAFAASIAPVAASAQGRSRSSSTSADGDDARRIAALSPWVTSRKRIAREPQARRVGR